MLRIERGRPARRAGGDLCCGFSSVSLGAAPFLQVSRRVGTTMWVGASARRGAGVASTSTIVVCRMRSATSTKKPIASHRDHAPAVKLVIAA